MVSVSKAIWNYFGFETLSNEKLIKIQASIERQYRDYHLELNQTKIPSYLKNFVGEKYEIELLYDAFVILLSARMFSFLAILIWLVNVIGKSTMMEKKIKFDFKFTLIENFDEFFTLETLLI